LVHPKNENQDERLAILINALIILSDEKASGKHVASKLKKYIKKDDIKNLKKAKKILESTFREAEKWT